MIWSKVAASSVLAVLFTIGGARLCVADAEPAPDKPLPVALVDAFNKLSSGPHAGYRANHAKGVMTEGEFTPAPTARQLSKTSHFQKRVPVLVRFSDPTGVPTCRMPAPM